jgi:hypothetical protein
MRLQSSLVRVIKVCQQACLYPLACTRIVVGIVVGIPSICNASLVAFFFDFANTTDVDGQYVR